MRNHATPEHAADRTPLPSHPGLHAIALVEMAKGALALLAASGLEIIGPASLRHGVLGLIRHFQLDPSGGVTGWLAQAINPGNLHIAAVIAALYGALHLLEGWGLWRAKVWASWLGCLSAAAYLPFDVTAFARHQHWLSATVIAVNLLVVGVLARDLHKRRQAG